MQVIFLHHSSFLVEVDERVLIFDYFAGDRVNGYSFTGRIPTYAEDTQITVFASHSHADHYDLDLLRMAEHYPKLRYVFSGDIRISPNFLSKHGIDPAVREKVLFVKPNRTYEWDGLRIDTLRSTDAGVAYYVDAHGVSIFHAGDLGDWSMDHAGDLINGKAHREYRHQIRKLARRPINLAFVPMDPRLGTHQADSLDYFLQVTDAEYVFPMHMWQDYSGIAAYKKRVSNRSFAERIVETERENQVFLFGEDGK